MNVSLLSSGVFGIVKTTLSNTLAVREDVSWQLVPLYGWAGSEVFINMVCGSLPTLKPLYERIVNKKPLRSSGARYDHYGTGNSTEKSRSRSIGKLFPGGGSKSRGISAVELHQLDDGHGTGRFAPEGHQIVVDQSFGYIYNTPGDHARGIQRIVPTETWG